MSDQSLDALVQRMQGKSVTQGWDAVVTMNRTKVNQLLEQQYIQQFNMNSFLKRIHALVPLDSNGRVGLDMSGLLLSKPLLSFENASLNASQARLTLNVVSGMIGYKSLGSDPRIISSFAVTEAHGFSVTMNIDLEAVMGSVNKHGEVILDLSKAYDFHCDMVENPVEQLALGDYFGGLFQRLPASSRVYRLGMLDFDPDDLLAPRSFQVRTQAAPGARDEHSDSYQDGAVVLFVRTRSSDHDGNNPGGDFPYLIPDDQDPVTGKRLFSGSLVLASRVIFDRHFHDFLQNTIGNGLVLEPLNDSNVDARGYKARGGGFTLDAFELQQEAGYDLYTMRSHGALNFSFAGVQSGSSALTVSAGEGGQLKLSWLSVDTFLFTFIEEWRNPVTPSKREEEVNVRFTTRFELHLRVEVDSLTSKVTFLPGSGNVLSCQTEKLGGDLDYQFNLQQECEALVVSRLEQINQQLQEINMVGLDLFALNHLLFPEQNALLLTHGKLPGDLALFGYIDPRHTSFSVEPTFVTVEAGSTHAFEILSTRLKAGAQAVTWSVSSVDGTLSTGEIDQNGTFTAPTRDRMQGQAVRNVVTASLRDPDSDAELSASSLVVVVGEGTVVMPSMATIDLSNTMDVELRASTLSGGDFKWTLVSGPGSLQANGARATYSPPASIDEDMAVALVEVEDTTSGGKALATMLVSGTRFMLKVVPYFHPGIPPKGRLRLGVEDTDIPGADITWSIIAGGGTVNPATGEFTAPEKITMPYSVVQAYYEDDFMDSQGYAVVFQSEYAQEATWFELSVFELEIDSTSNLYANGYQQVSVKITVDPMDVDGEPVQVSDSEFASIELVDADTHEPLSVVDEEGISADEQIWAYNKAEDARFEYFPNSPVLTAPGLRTARTKHLYVQTRARTTLEIAALITRDDFAKFHSNDDGGSVADKKTIKPNPIAPPDFHEEGFAFEATRIYGGEEDDYNMDTVDFYILQLRDGPDRALAFRSVEFEQRSGMVQWESRQFQEDVASFTGYALPGETELTFDPPLQKYLTDAGVNLRSEVPQGHICPPGALLISLHRVQYWYFNQVCEETYAKPMPLTLLDIYGNKHRVSISFASNIDRHKVVVRSI